MACMKRSRVLLSGIVLAVVIVAGRESAWTADSADATAVIDWTRAEGCVNRPLFSTQGFMQVYVEPNPLVMDTFTLINPAGTHTRLETYIHQMEPENDNADPETFDWSKFHVDKQIRFIEDRGAFLKVVDTLGMEPLALLCYNVDWLKSDDPDDQIKDEDEWAEFAAAVVQSYNGTGEDYRPALRLVEIWNEPNWSNFIMGTKQAYFDLYNTAARRIHRDYPGVIVGGPCVTGADPHAGEWMDAFMDECGDETDALIYHVYGQSPEQMVSDFRRWVEEFRTRPGKERARLMLTETDQWIHGWPKVQYILERQFRFIDISDLLMSVHHFCCLAYREAGNYTFGIVDENGAVLGGTFWPYWLFRNWIGEEAHFMRQGPSAADFDLAASWDVNDAGQWIGTAVFHNKTEKPLAIDTLLYFPASKKDRVLTRNRASRGYFGVSSAEKVNAGETSRRIRLMLSPGEGFAFVLQEPGKRFFGFRDLNNQETPWVGLDAQKESVGFDETNTLRVRVVNTTFEPVSGELSVKGLPRGWTAEPAAGSSARIENLAFGDVHECSFQFRAASVIRGDRMAPYVVLDSPNCKAEPVPVKTDQVATAGTIHSIPVSIEVKNPISTQILPIPVYALAGERNQVTLQATNRSDQTLNGTLRFEAPEGFAPQDVPKRFSLPAGERARFQFPFEIPEVTAAGSHSGRIVMEFLGTELASEFAVQVVEGKPRADAVALDLRPYANFDAVAFYSNRTDYDSEPMGMFVYPADFTPSGRMVRVRGVPYRMLGLEDGLKNSILPQGQRIDVPEGMYAGVSFLGFGHDGKHPGTWVFHYADGSKEEVVSQIPEWCSSVPEGPEDFQEAFTAPHRYIDGGPALPGCQLFTWTLKTDAEKELTSMELPKMEDAYLFAITLLPE